MYFHGFLSSVVTKGCWMTIKFVEIFLLSKNISGLLNPHMFQFQSSIFGKKQSTKFWALQSLIICGICFIWQYVTGIIN